MAIDVETKDCTALSDAELGEMADICADGPAGYDVGLLSKQREEWVLITQVRDGGKLLGFSFCTLERIGGIASIKSEIIDDCALARRLKEHGPIWLGLTPRVFAKATTRSTMAKLSSLK